MDLYLRFSRMAHEIYADYTDLQEPYGIDESWLDVTDSCSLKGDGLSIAINLYDQPYIPAQQVSQISYASIHLHHP